MKLSKARLIVAYRMACDLATEFSKLGPNNVLLRDLATARDRAGLTVGDVHEADRVVKAAGDPGLFKEVNQ